MLFNPNMAFKNVDFPELILPITGIVNLFIFIYLKYFELNSFFHLRKFYANASIHLMMN